MEWPTVAVAAAVYGGWLAVTWLHGRLPTCLLAAMGGWLVAWHGSLQHETIHGHPTRSGRINAIIGGAPLSLWLPYRCYAASHMAHHLTERVTDPVADPESRYFRAAGGLFARCWSRAQGTLSGRLALGPIDASVRFLVRECRRAAAAPSAVARDWLPHLIGSVVVVAWLSFCGIGLGRYVLLFVYPGISLSLLRSFAEHRAAREPGHRVALVEGGGPLALLFLNNNLHAAHHRSPRTAWYRLPAYHRANRSDLLAENGGLLYRGYGEIALRYVFRRHDAPVHPDWR